MAIKVKDTVLQVRIESDILKDFVEAADFQGMTSSAFARHLIKRQVEHFNDFKIKQASQVNGGKK